MLPTIIFDLNRTLLNPDTTDPYPDSLVVLNHFKKLGYQLILVAQAREGRSEIVDQLFSDYFVERYFVANKSTKLFRDITRRHNIDISHSYVIGDRARKELLFGYRAGFQTIWLKHDKFANELPQHFVPTYTIQHLSELPKLT